jgi:hypothetical protein
MYLQLLLATFAGWVTRRRAQVISCLIEENTLACAVALDHFTTTTRPLAMDRPEVNR